MSTAKMNRGSAGIRVLTLVACCAVLGLCLIGCGGGGGGTGVASSATATGRFVDAPIAGLTYESGKITGVTKADGSFTYEVGKTVKFSIGGKIVLGQTNGQSIVTPVDLATVPNATATTPGVTRIVRLLMTLNNGTNDKMSLASDVLLAATRQPVTDVQLLDDAALLALAKGLDASKTSLVTAADANDHMAGSLGKLLEGTWIQGDPTSSSVLAITFLDSSHYVGIEKNPTDADGHTGMEMGAYSWDPKTMKMTGNGNKTADTNGDWGFDQGSTFGAALSGNSLTIEKPDDPKFTRLVSDPAKPLVGAWISGPADAGNSVLLIFLPDGKFLMAEHHVMVDPGCHDGIELGTYSWNSTTGAITVKITSDTSGDWGFSDAGPVTITVSGNTLSWHNKDGDNTCTRVGS